MKTRGRTEKEKLENEKERKEVVGEKEKIDKRNKRRKSRESKNGSSRRLKREKIMVKEEMKKWKRISISSVHK